MDEKISLEAISRYSEEYTDKELQRIFSTQDKISGQQILSVSDIPQLNLFIVGELFKAWKEETKKLRSPYFNYESPEVKDALEALRTHLSNNILVDRQHFAALFKAAVNRTLLVVLDPYDFFSLLISGQNNRLDVVSFREEIKYLKVNKAPLDRLLQKLVDEGLNEISGNEGFAILDQILEEVNFNPEDVDPYIEKFSSVVPLDVSTFYTKKRTESVQKQEKNNGSTLPIENVEPLQEKESKTGTFYDTINKGSRPSLAEDFQKIGKIKDSLTINQKFMFTKVLFHGDFELFSKAIDHLDRQDNMKGALRYIEQEHASTWDKESEEFHEFMELVEKRFAS